MRGPVTFEGRLLLVAVAFLLFGTLSTHWRSGQAQATTLPLPAKAKRYMLLNDKQISRPWDPSEGIKMNLPPRTQLQTNINGLSVDKARCNATLCTSSCGSIWTGNFISQQSNGIVVDDTPNSSYGSERGNREAPVRDVKGPALAGTPSPAPAPPASINTAKAYICIVAWFAIVIGVNLESGVAAARCRSNYVVITFAYDFTNRQLLAWQRERYRFRTAERKGAAQLVQTSVGLPIQRDSSMHFAIKKDGN